MALFMDLPRISGTPPKFTKLLTDILVPEGETAILECEVDGSPQPEITWLFNNKPVGPDDRFEVFFFLNCIAHTNKIILNQIVINNIKLAYNKHVAYKCYL